MYQEKPDTPHANTTLLGINMPNPIAAAPRRFRSCTSDFMFIAFLCLIYSDLCHSKRI